MQLHYNILIDVVGTLLVSVILMTRRKQKRHGDPMLAQLLHSLMTCCTLVFMADIPGLVLDGRSFPGAAVLLWIVDTAYWLFQIVYCWLWLLFTDYWAFGSRERLKKRRLLYALPLLAELISILINPATRWVFTIDAANCYARGQLYLWNMLPYVISVSAAILIAVYGSRRSPDPTRKRRCVALVIYMILPVCGILLNAFVYGVSWLWPTVALSLLMVYLNVQDQAISEEQFSAAKLEAELTESRVAIMLSQIQPHFLYNSLNTIDALCDVDTKAAQTAIRSFARYLRGNMDALSRKTPVPFRDELSHLREYLTLETFRFDNIQIDYDLEIMDFMLPALSLQPIVENAVKYGVLERENGGTITISTRDKRDYVQLTVQDDGVGFDQTSQPDTRRSHIGISNVRSRLESMCGGTLTVESRPDVGTIVTFHIPWGGQNTCGQSL